MGGDQSQNGDGGKGKRRKRDRIFERAVFAVLIERPVESKR